MRTNKSADAVVADVGPFDKFGEASIFLAQQLGVASSPMSGGDATPLYSYTWWPGIAALIDGVQYLLQPIYEA
jgi:hypothetical protein